MLCECVCDVNILSTTNHPNIATSMATCTSARVPKHVKTLNKSARRSKRVGNFDLPERRLDAFVLSEAEGHNNFDYDEDVVLANHDYDYDDFMYGLFYSDWTTTTTNYNDWVIYGDDDTTLRCDICNRILNE